MKRISGLYKAEDLFGVGKPGFRDGDAVNGIFATQLNALQFNHMQEAVCRTIERAGLVLSDIDYDQFVTAIVALSGGSSGFKNLTGDNDVAAPLTKYTISSSKTTYDLIAGGILTDSGGTYTVDLSAAGPVVNGRDQAAAFPASSWVYVHAVTNGIAKGLIASLSETAPTLPAGYVGSVVAAPVYVNSLGQIVKMEMRGQRFFWPGDQLVLSNASVPGLSGPISLSSVMPPNALTAMLNGFGYMQVGAGGAALAAFATLRLPGSAADFFVAYPTAGPGQFADWGFSTEIPNVGRQVYSFVTPSAIEYHINVRAMGFTYANGAR